MWLRMHRVPSISPSEKKQRNTFTGSQPLNGASPSVESRRGEAILVLNVNLAAGLSQQCHTQIRSGRTEMQCVRAIRIGGGLENRRLDLIERSGLHRNRKCNGLGNRWCSVDSVTSDCHVGRWKTGSLTFLADRRLQAVEVSAQQPSLCFA